MPAILPHAAAARPGVDNRAPGRYGARMLPSCGQRCPWCGHSLALVWVHGHGQCSRCGTNLEECCRGETAEPARALAFAPGPGLPVTAGALDRGERG